MSRLNSCSQTIIIDFFFIHFQVQFGRKRLWEEGLDFDIFCYKIINFLSGSNLVVIVNIFDYGDPQSDVGSAKRVIICGFLLVKSCRFFID